jgi:hypothetical protein
MYGAFDSSLLFLSCVYKGKYRYYFTTKQYRIKGFFSEVHACVHGADAFTHTLSAPFWEIVMLRKQDTLILSELYINVVTDTAAIIFFYY